ITEAGLELLPQVLAPRGQLASRLRPGQDEMRHVGKGESRRPDDWLRSDGARHGTGPRRASSQGLTAYRDAGFRSMPEAESPSRKSVGLATSCTKARSASSTKARRSARSRSGPRLGSPRTWGIATPRMTRGTPRLRGIAGTADTSATGIPLRSISNAI